ncbi:MAG: hypothetical protein H7138_27650 [Myxococcales bacterium]|nr:hypothetical protein [Myxococcales bacterium]
MNAQGHASQRNPPSQSGHGHPNAQHHPSHQGSGPTSQVGPQSHGHASSPHVGSNGYHYSGPSMGSPVAAPTRSNALVFALIAILIAAIGVLAYLVLTK